MIRLCRRIRYAFNDALQPLKYYVFYLLRKKERTILWGRVFRAFHPYSMNAIWRKHVWDHLDIRDKKIRRIASNEISLEFCNSAHSEIAQQLNKRRMLNISLNTNRAFPLTKNIDNRKQIQHLTNPL